MITSQLYIQKHSRVYVWTTFVPIAFLVQNMYAKETTYEIQIQNRKWRVTVRIWSVSVSWCNISWDFIHQYIGRFFVSIRRESIRGNDFQNSTIQMLDLIPLKSFFFLFLFSIYFRLLFRSLGIQTHHSIEMMFKTVLFDISWVYTHTRRQLH